MRRIYACIAIVAVLLMAAFYSSWKVQHFAEEIFSGIDTAMEAIRDEDFTTARKALAHGADLCDQMRMHMTCSAPRILQSWKPPSARQTATWK